MPATVLKGIFQKVTVGTYPLLGAGEYSLSGLTRETLDAGEFTDDVTTYEFGVLDGGTITVNNVLYDPTDSTGQALFGSGGLRFYVNSTSYRTVASGGFILVTKAGALEAQRNGLARCSFEAKVSGKSMVLV
jgi:hypothetical protein